MVRTILICSLTSILLQGYAQDDLRARITGEWQLTGRGFLGKHSSVPEDSIITMWLSINGTYTSSFINIGPSLSDGLYESGTWSLEDEVVLMINARRGDGSVLQYEREIQSLGDSTCVLSEGKTTLYYTRKSGPERIETPAYVPNGTRQEFMLISNETDEIDYIPFGHYITIDLRDTVSRKEGEGIYRTLKGEVTGVKNGILSFRYRREDSYEFGNGFERSIDITYDEPLTIDIPQEMVEDMWYRSKRKTSMMVIGGALLGGGLVYMAFAPQMTLLRNQQFNTGNYNENVLIGAIGVGLSIPFFLLGSDKHYTLWTPEFCPYETWSVYPTDR